MNLPRKLAQAALVQRHVSRHPGLKVINGDSNRLKGFYSQDGQDAFVYSEFFPFFENEKIPKLFVDIGCNHPVQYSNSYFFEKHLGFKCIAVDPLPTYASLWSELRRSSRFHQVALGSAPSTAKLLMPRDPKVKAGESHSADMFSTLLNETSKVDSGKFQQVDVPVVTAAALLDQENISAVGILSIDVEGFEMEVLKGYDFARHPADIVLVENNTTGRMGSDAIREYLIRQGYAYHARFWRMDDVFVSARLRASP